MDYKLFFDWMQRVFSSFGDLGSWLVKPIEFGGLSIAPIWLITGGGLTAFIGVALLLWVVDGAL